MQSIASNTGVIPNIQGLTLGDHGTLVMHLPGDVWVYFGENWLPNTPMSKREFIKTFHKAPPANVPMGSWGVVQGLIDDVTCRDRNWTKVEIRAAIDQFMEDHSGEYIEPSVASIRPMGTTAVTAKQRALWDNKITPAPRPQRVHRGRAIISR